MPYSTAELAKHNEVMTAGEPVTVRLATYDRRSSTGTVRVRRIPEEERKKRARRFLFMCLAPCCVMWIVPPHILWILILTITGVVGYVVRKGRPLTVLGGEGPCPQCGAVQFLAATNNSFPLIHFCTECRERADVTEAAPAPSTSNG